MLNSSIVFAEEKMKIITKLAKHQYDHNRDSETHLLVQLEAPKVEWNEKRKPICILPVIDVSGSMAGQKIDYVRKACRKLIDNLSIGDLMGIVAFDSYVYSISPVVEITQYHKDQLKEKVLQLQAGSSTNMSGGLQTAFRMLAESNITDDITLRVVLFTDGHANVGVSGRNLLEFVKEHKGKASLSCFGFGTDCDQELLADMAMSVDGNYAYIDSPDSALSAFARELGGLMSIYAQDIDITIKPNENNQILEILNDERVEDKDGVATISLKDILGEEKKSIVAKVKLGEVAQALPRKVNAFKISVAYTDFEGKKQSAEEILKVKFCKPNEEPAEEDNEVVLQRDRFLVAKFQKEAEEFARRGMYQQAQGVMVNCCSLISDTDMIASVNNLSNNYASAVSYNSSKGETNTAKAVFSGKRVSHFSSRSRGLAGKFQVDSTHISNLVKEFENTNDATDGSTTSTITKNKIDREDW